MSSINNTNPFSNVQSRTFDDIMAAKMAETRSQALGHRLMAFQNDPHDAQLADLTNIFSAFKPAHP